MDQVMIIDYGMGNLFSVKRAFEKCGAKVSITENPKELSNASHIVLPGVGAFKDGMSNLKKKNWDNYIQEAVCGKRTPILGICLGMQLLADRGYEVEETEGLGLISGEVVKFKPTVLDERVPHVGWNEIKIEQSNNFLVNDIQEKTDFYFVHSYHFETEKDVVIAKTPYCNGFNSIVGKDLIYGVQFHPEKSHKAGFKLIRNFLDF